MAHSVKLDGHVRLKIPTLADSYKMAGESFGGGAFSFLTLLGCGVAALKAYSVHLDPSAAEISAIAAKGLEAIFIAFLAWRVRIGRGAISGLLLVGLYVLEMIGTYSSGDPRLNIGFVVMHLCILVSIVLGAYACIVIRLRERRGELGTASP